MWRPGKLRFLIGVKNPLPIRPATTARKRGPLRAPPVAGFATPVGLRPPFVTHPATLSHPDRRAFPILFAAPSERHVCAVVRVPSVEEEDARLSHGPLGPRAERRVDPIGSRRSIVYRSAKNQARCRRCATLGAVISTGHSGTQGEGGHP